MQFEEIKHALPVPVSGDLLGQIVLGSLDYPKFFRLPAALKERLAISGLM